MEEPEPVAIRAAMAGDTAAFEHLVRVYQANVFRFLRHLVSDPGLAEDITQETFLRVYQRLPTFDFRAKFSTWLFQIARNAGIDALRSRTRRDRLVHAVAAMPPRTQVPADLRVEIQAAVATLSPKLREALLLVEVLGFTYREAALVLRVPEGTVKSRVFQARERLVAWRNAREEATGGL